MRLILVDIHDVASMTVDIISSGRKRSLKNDYLAFKSTFSYASFILAILAFASSQVRPLTVHLSG
jgi:hypothetical protein